MENKVLPDFYNKAEFMKESERFPEYKNEQRLLNMQNRLLLLDSIYDVYVPTEMSYEVYSKIYVALSRSLNKKFTKDAVRQRYENHRRIKRDNSNGLIGGGDSILITGTAGIGKSSAIDNAVRLLTDRIIETDTTKIIPVLIVQCPFDCSIKSLLIDIIRNVDFILDTEYSHFARLKGQTTDVLIGVVSQVALNHIGVLIIDEIQNVVKNKHGNNLVGALTQLINNSGTSIVMVGTPESKSFFEKEEFFARRAMGMSYSKNRYDDEFVKLVKKVATLNYTRKKSELIESDYPWIFEHTNGLPSNVIALFHDAQEIALTRGTETLNRENLEMAYRERMGTLHTYIESNRTTIAKNRRKAVSKTNKAMLDNKGSFSFESICESGPKDMILALKEFVEVVEV